MKCVLSTPIFSIPSSMKKNQIALICVEINKSCQLLEQYDKIIASSMKLIQWGGKPTRFHITPKSSFQSGQKN